MKVVMTRWVPGLVLLAGLVAAPAPAQELTAEERVYGLSVIWQEANYNFAFFDQVPELDWDSAYQAFLPAVLAAETTVEYYRTLQRFVALLQDGHTDVWFPAALRDARDWSYPWVLTRRVAGQAYVTNVGASLADRVPVGSLITRIDGRPVADHLEDRVLPYVAASTTHDRFERAVRSLLHGPAGSTVAIDFLTPDGAVDRLELVRDRRTREDQWVPDPNVARPRFELSWPEEGVALVALNTFDDRAVVDDWLAALPELRAARALILDVRANGGGSSGVGYAVASWITDDSLATSAWRTREHRAAFKAWGRFNPEAADWAAMDRWHDGGTHGTVAPADGRRLILPTVVLQDHGTFSAAEDFLVALDAVAHVTTVGRATGGSTGQPLILDLPGGGGARICTKRDTYPDGRDFVGVGIIPDVVVEPSVDDVRSGRDPMLARALELLRIAAPPG